MQTQVRAPSASENALSNQVELRGLGPLTPTLPGRLRGVHPGTLLCVPAGQGVVRSSVNDREPP